MHNQKYNWVVWSYQSVEYKLQKQSGMIQIKIIIAWFKSPRLLRHDSGPSESIISRLSRQLTHLVHNCSIPYSN